MNLLHCIAKVLYQTFTVSLLNSNHDMVMQLVCIPTIPVVCDGSAKKCSGNPSREVYFLFSCYCHHVANHLYIQLLWASTNVSELHGYWNLDSSSLTKTLSHAPPVSQILLALSTIAFISIDLELSVQFGTIVFRNHTLITVNTKVL